MKNCGEVGVVALLTIRVLPLYIAAQFGPGTHRESSGRNEAVLLPLYVTSDW